jgi:uncharacterized protein (DUF1778 family)
MHMTSAKKTEAVNFRMAPDVKELLRLAAEQEHRTLTNMLEVLVIQHCEQRGISLPRSARRRPASEQK